jgi:hypothetical protein
VAAVVVIVVNIAMVIIAHTSGIYAFSVAVTVVMSLTHCVTASVVGVVITTSPSMRSPL